ncbi:hypothetical protein XENOCAPTIV_007654, partial [Xenoophorus captivus]
VKCEAPVKGGNLIHFSVPELSNGHLCRFFARCSLCLLICSCLFNLSVCVDAVDEPLLAGGWCTLQFGKLILLDVLPSFLEAFVRPLLFLERCVVDIHLSASSSLVADLITGCRIVGTQHGHMVRFLVRPTLLMFVLTSKHVCVSSWTGVSRNWEMSFSSGKSSSMGST